MPECSKIQMKVYKKKTNLTDTWMCSVLREEKDGQGSRKQEGRTEMDPTIGIQLTKIFC